MSMIDLNYYGPGPGTPSHYPRPYDQNFYMNGPPPPMNSEMFYVMESGYVNDRGTENEYSHYDLENGGVGLDWSVNSPPYGNEVKSNTGITLSADLFHRPRGQGGKWLKIEDNERVRVSPSTGKNLRMIISSSFAFEEKDLIIIPKNIIDDKVYERGTESIQITTFHGSVKQTDGFFDSQIDLKLFLQGQIMKLLVEVSHEGTKHSACTIQFSTHNSGKTNNPTKRKREDSFTVNQDIPIVIKEEGLKRQKINEGTYQAPPMFQNAQVIDSDVDVIGIIRARAFYQYSDMNLKTNIEEIVDAMHIITSLSGKRFQWKEGVPFENKGQTVIGLLAQEVQRVAPEVVQLMDDGYLSVNYAELIPVIISAFNQHLEQVSKDKEDVETYIQELRDNIAVLTNKDYEFEKDNDMLQNKLNDLQKIVSCMKQELQLKKSKSETTIPPKK